MEGVPNNLSTDRALDVIEMFGQSFYVIAKKQSESLH